MPPVRTNLLGTIDELLARSRELRLRHVQLMNKRTVLLSRVNVRRRRFLQLSDRLQRLRRQASAQLTSSPLKIDRPTN
jgi:hypothetical protein